MNKKWQPIWLIEAYVYSQHMPSNRNENFLIYQLVLYLKDVWNEALKSENYSENHEIP